MKKQTERREKNLRRNSAAVSKPTSRERILRNLLCLFYSEAYCVAVLGVCVLFFIRRCFVCLGYEPGCSHSSYTSAGELWPCHVNRWPSASWAGWADQRCSPGSSVWVSPRMNSLITSHPKQSSYQEMRGQNNVYSSNAAVLKSTL